MSAARSRRLVTAGLSLALAVAAPGAALADHAPRHDPQGERSSTGHASAGGGKGKASGAAPTSSSSSGKTSSSGKSSSSGVGSGTSPTGSGSGSDQARTDRDPGGPRGNNGTVKIDGEAFDDGRGNEPHVGCVLSVDFYGFDAGDGATVTLTGQAPTGGGLLHSQHSTISEDAAGGGQDRDATLVLSVQDQLSELLSIPPHPQQGWHVKLAVDVDDAPGGAKQKVFWISCPQVPAVSGTVTEAATSAGGTDVTVAKRDIVETPIAGGGGAVAQRRAVLAGTSARRASAEASGRVSAASPARGGAEAVAAQGAVPPQALPFTGAQALGGLLALGLAGVAAGGAAARLGSRHAAQG